MGVVDVAISMTLLRLLTGLDHLAVACHLSFVSYRRQVVTFVEVRLWSWGVVVFGLFVTDGGRFVCERMRRFAVRRRAFPFRGDGGARGVRLLCFVVQRHGCSLEMFDPWPIGV